MVGDRTTAHVPDQYDASPMHMSTRTDLHMQLVCLSTERLTADGSGLWVAPEIHLSSRRSKYFNDNQPQTIPGTNENSRQTSIRTRLQNAVIVKAMPEAHTKVDSSGDGCPVMFSDMSCPPIRQPEADRW